RGLIEGETKERDLSWLDASSPSDLSNDGKTLVLTERGEGSGHTPSVYIRGTDGSPAVRLGEGLAMALSPDGRWGLTPNHQGGGKPPFAALLATGAGQTKALRNPGFEDLEWGAFLSDGKSLLYEARMPHASSRLYLQAVPDGEPRPIGPEGVTLDWWSSPVS